MSLLRRFLVLAFPICFLQTVQSEVTLPAIISDHMVLQQEQQVTIWGWANPGEEVTVRGSWFQEASMAIAKDKGEWKLDIETPSSSANHTLTISGENTITINDILIGEVWVCGGQSNMRWPVGNLGTERAETDIANANYPQIRFFTVAHNFITTPIDHLKGEWQICSPETIRKFSVTGFYFGKNLFENLQQPIGLISSNSGGTPSKAWMSREALVDFGGFDKELEYAAKYEDQETEIKQENERIHKQWHALLEDQDNGVEAGYHTSWFNDDDWASMRLPATWKKHH